MKYSVLDLAWAKGTSEPTRAALLEMHNKLNRQDALLRQALEALENSIAVPCYGGHPVQEAAAAEIKEHLDE